VVFIVVLEVSGINKSFGSNHVLRDVSFSARGGAAFGLIGRNGSGKTTTIRVIMNLFPADSGTVTVDGEAISKSSARFGYLPEERGLYPKRVIAEQMSYIGQLRGLTARDARERSKQMLEKLEAEEYYHKKLDTLSKGNQQKIQLAIALINDPEIVILDEPFSGLDPVNARILKNLVQELVRDGRIVIFSSHQMNNVEEFCDDICMIDKGEIVMSGNLREIKMAYPRDKFLVSPEDGDLEKFAAYLRSDGGLSGVVSHVGVSPRGCVVTLEDESKRQSLLAALSRGERSIASYSVMEPTLEEIFVERAGRADEEV
jgi:ABC-2 type transport system ATP-binding protein